MLSPKYTGPPARTYKVALSPRTSRGMTWSEVTISCNNPCDILDPLAANAEPAGAEDPLRADVAVIESPAVVADPGNADVPLRPEDPLTATVTKPPAGAARVRVLAAGTLATTVTSPLAGRARAELLPEAPPIVEDALPTPTGAQLPALAADATTVAVTVALAAGALPKARAGGPVILNDDAVVAEPPCVLV